MCLMLVCRLHISAGLRLTGTKQAPGLRTPNPALRTAEWISIMADLLGSTTQDVGLDISSKETSYRQKDLG